MTAAYVFVDMEKNISRYAGAGHPPLLLWRASSQSASEVLENGMLLGLFREASYSFVEVPLEPGDKAILYTDGVLETRSPSEQEYGADLWKGFMESNMLSRRKGLQIRCLMSWRPGLNARRGRTGG